LTDEDQILTANPISQLREIESSLLHMIEERDYIEQQSQVSKEVAQKFTEAEKNVEKYRK